MKKKDIIQLVKETIKEVDHFGNRQGPSNFQTSAVAPTDEYPFSKRPKRTGTGMMEDESTSFKVVNADTGKTIDFGLDKAKALEIAALAIEDNINAEVVKMKNVDDVGKLKESQGTLSSDMLNYADQYHMELVDTMKGVSTHPDKRTGGFRILFPHYNGPDYTGAMFGKDVSMKIEKSKAAAKAAALKTVEGFKTEIEDYGITDKSRAGVHGSIHLWIMPKTMDEAPMFKTDVKQDMAPKEMAGRIKDVFNKVNGAQDPVRTPEWHKNRFKNKYGISFPETLKGINKDQAIAMNKYANDMKITEADTKTYAGVDSVTSMKKDPRYGTLSGDAKVDLEKKLKDGGAVELEEEDLTYEPEDMDNPDEDLVIIGSGYLDIKSNFGERPSQTNGEYAEIGQKVVDQLHNGDKEAALDFIYSKINENRDEEDEGESMNNADIGILNDLVQKYSPEKLKITIDILSKGTTLSSQGVDRVDGPYGDKSVDMENMMESYIKERGDSNLMEHMDKHRKRAVLMEGAMKKFFEMFDRGMTDEEVIQDYA
ncbi:MAG: hypothetical protein HOB69_06245, partial [Flavobacterium sp.]|nr:hypothetical protein [Flavobacterium sp.]